MQQFEKLCDINAWTLLLPQSSAQSAYTEGNQDTICTHTRNQDVGMNPTIFTLLAVALVGQMVNGANATQLTAAASSFSLDLYQEIAVNEDNIIYSPFSIHSCISMCSLGARGTTASEISDALGLTSVTNPHQAYQDLITRTNSVTDVELYTANALFLNPSYSIKTSFVNAAQTFYFATVDNIDFSATGGPEQPINDYVSDNTQGLIEDLLPPGSIDSLTVLVLVNTVFFNGTWKDTFSQSNTRPQNFYQLSGSTTQVDMMNDDRYVNIKRRVFGADVLELPFKDEDFALYIVLPRRRNGIKLLETRLANCGNIDDYLFKGLQRTYVRIGVPKFKIESEFELTPALQNLGIVQAFTTNADFSGISNTPNLYISSVIHKAVIEVKETGTVAAAATAILIRTTSVMLPPTEQFIADHPFLFFLRDNATGNILFQGKFSG